MYDIDSFVDYGAEYTALLSKPKIKGGSIEGLCPFHDDHHVGSFHADLKTGKFFCHACNTGGNFLDFKAKLDGTSTKEAYAALCKQYGKQVEASSESRPNNQAERMHYTLEDYAAEKNLPIDFLKDTFQLSSGSARNGETWVRTPYFDVDGNQILFRKRLHPKNEPRFKWGQGASGKLSLYGLWGKKRFLEKGFDSVCLVEGESDTQTLWYLGIPAFGVPGASTFKPELVPLLDGIPRILIHQEPDDGGNSFRNKVIDSLIQGGYRGAVSVFRCSSVGAKDPSDVYLAHGKERASELITEAMRQCEDVDLLTVASSATMEMLPGAPCSLRQPEGYMFSMEGISKIDEQSGKPAVFCKTPIIIYRRIKPLDDNVESIEIAYYRDGEWNTHIFPRNILAQQHSAVDALSQLGCAINCENIKPFIRYFDALEKANYNDIEAVSSASSFGWFGKGRFLPGFAPDVVIDVPDTMRHFASAYCKNGTFEAWKDCMAPHRKRYRFRFILASAFSAPLLNILNHRIFFVYNWGDSKGGKSAALKAALSVWGDPDKLMVNFNATAVALERIAGFYCDLPLGIDERQLAGNNQDSLEKIIYMLSSGKGKSRGSKSGGLQSTQAWRTVILATGEEPISQDASMTGVSTRVLEIYGGPFDNERDAGLMHQRAEQNFGWAGEEFMRHLIETDRFEVQERFTAFQDYVFSCMDGRNGSHVSSIATVGLADAMVSEWVFGETREDSERKAKRMIDSIVSSNRENSENDVNQNAVDFVSGWIASNKDQFTDGYRISKYGEFDTSEGTVWVICSALNKALTDAGFSAKKTLRYMSENGIAAQFPGDRGRGIRLQGKRRIAGVSTRAYCLNLLALSGENIQDSPDIEDDIEDDAPPF